jgi:UDP-N-acetylglucosamine--N-acetylmuramyl-(pentapeptide) pyrophosphoryl-undecaprenol N-acetylglucosamine transferase
MSGPVVITGGGTGGHVFPMQAIGEALLATGRRREELRYVGSGRGQERALFADSGIAVTLLPGRGLRRSLRARALVQNVGAAFGLVVALARALGLVARWRPAAVVTVGGYASFAISVAAVLLRRPLIVVEIDATPGAVQRLVGRFAVTRCCAFATSGSNVVVTGAPLREAIETIDRSADARQRARANQAPPIETGREVVVVMTGSLGSSTVNHAVADVATRWASRSDRTIVHVTGQRDYEHYAARASVPPGLDYRVVAFADMTELWSVCDVAVCRAGAMTIAELTALAIPSVLVPLPGAPGDHQTKNAQAVVAAGGARLVPDAQCTGERLVAELDAVMTPAASTSMSRGAGSLAHHGAARAIALEVEKAARA